MVNIGDGLLISLISAIGCFIISFQFGFQIYRLAQDESKALKGDTEAANRLLLPCYKNLFQFMCIVYFLFGLLLLVSISDVFDDRLSLSGRFHIIQYFLFLQQVIFTSVPLLFIYPYASLTSFINTAKLVTPWILVVTPCWVIGALHDDMRAEVAFSVLACTPPVLLVILLVRKVVPSRMDIKSVSFRSALIYLVVFTVIFLSFNVIYDTVEYTDEQENKIASSPGTDRLLVIVIFTVCMFGWVFLYPMFLLPTLLADTQFWRGIGRRESGRTISSNSQMELSPLEMNVASQQIQQMMENVGNALIDFALVKKSKLIGSGSTSSVYNGWYGSIKVAIKVSTPPELNEDSMKDIVIETENMKRLNHPNICKFYGLMVKPPQISLVMELCEKGDLKGHLMNPKNANTYWTPAHRIRACLECSMGVAYLHHNNMIHRDVKLNNFFIDDLMKIKLGDFGESTLRRESEAGRTMTIVGTVNYMAPELINGDRNYTSAIDIYSLGIVFWELWTGSEAFKNVSNTFAVYEMVQAGKRPEIPTGTPTELSDLINEAWRANPEERPKAITLVKRLCELLTFVATQADCAHDEEFATTIAKAAINNDSTTTAYTPQSSTNKIMTKGLKVIESLGDKLSMFRDSTMERISNIGINNSSVSVGDDYAIAIESHVQEQESPFKNWDFQGDSEDNAVNPIHSPNRNR